jgi:hypothetical protein
MSRRRSAGGIGVASGQLSRNQTIRSRQRRTVRPLPARTRLKTCRCSMARRPIASSDIPVAATKAAVISRISSIGSRMVFSAETP